MKIQNQALIWRQNLSNLEELQKKQQRGLIINGKRKCYQRHVETLRDILKDVSKLVRTVEGEKITAKQNSDNIDTWVEGMESKKNNRDKKINFLEEWLNKARKKRETRP